VSHEKRCSVFYAPRLSGTHVGNNWGQGRRSLRGGITTSLQRVIVRDESGMFDPCGNARSAERRSGRET